MREQRIHLLFTSHSSLRCGCLLLALAYAVPLFSPAAAAVPAPLDVVLLIDNSRSMRTNDPQRLMVPALRAFPSRLPPMTHVGVVVFDSSVRTVLELMSTSDASFPERFADALNKVDYTGQWTDIPGGIERAVYDLRSTGRPGDEARRAVVLFTDGTVDLGNPEIDKQRKAWLHGTVTAEAIRERVEVFGVAFTYTADFQLLQTLSTATFGKPFLIETPARIAPVLNDIAVALQQPIKRDPGPSPPPPPPPPPTDWRWFGGACGAAGLAAAGYFLYARLSSPSEIATLTGIGALPQTYTLNKRVFRIGRKPRVGLWRMDLLIPDKEKFVGRFHAQIQYRGGQFYLHDNDSIHGTFMSEGESTPLRRLKRGETVLLSDGARVAFHAHEYRFGSSAPDLRQGESDETTKEGGRAPSRELTPCQKCGVPCAPVKWKKFSVCDGCRAKIDGMDDAALDALAVELESALRNMRTDRD